MLCDDLSAFRDRPIGRIPAAELGRVETSSRAETSLVQWSGEDRLIPTPECSSCSGELVRHLEWIGLF